MKKNLIFFVIVASVLLFSHNFQFLYAQNQFELGMNFLKQDQNKEAIIIFDEILLEDSKNTKVLIAMGIAKANIKNFEDARKYFDLALEIDPNNISALNNKSLLEVKTENYDIAEEIAENVLSIDSTNEIAQKIKENVVQIKKINSLSKEGVELANERKYTNAIEKFEEILEIEPDNTSALNNKALSYAHIGKINKAFVIFQEVLEIEPDNTIALFNLGVSLSTIGNQQEAKKILKKILEIEPDNERVKDYLIRINNFWKIISPFEKNLSGTPIFFQTSIWDKYGNIISYTESDQVYSLYYDELLLRIDELPDRSEIVDEKNLRNYFFKENEKFVFDGVEGELIKIHQIGVYDGQNSIISLTYFNPDDDKVLLIGEHGAYFLAQGDRIHTTWSIFLENS